MGLELGVDGLGLGLALALGLGLGLGLGFTWPSGVTRAARARAWRGGVWKMPG